MVNEGKSGPAFWADVNLLNDVSLFSGKRTKDILRYEVGDKERSYESIDTMSENELTTKFLILSLISVLLPVFLSFGFEKFSEYVDASSQDQGTTPSQSQAKKITRRIKEKKSNRRRVEIKKSQRQDELESGKSSGHIKTKILMFWFIVSYFVFEIHTKSFHLWNESPKAYYGNSLVQHIEFLKLYSRMTPFRIEGFLNQIAKEVEFFENVLQDFGYLHNAWCLSLVYLIMSMFFLCSFIENKRSNFTNTIFYISLITLLYIKVIIPMLCTYMHRDSYVILENSRKLLAHFVLRLFT